MLDRPRITLGRRKSKADFILTVLKITDRMTLIIKFNGSFKIPFQPSNNLEVSNSGLASPGIRVESLKNPMNNIKNIEAT